MPFPKDHPNIYVSDTPYLPPFSGIAFGLVFGLVLSIGVAIAGADDTGGPHGNVAVMVKLWPRSEWDPHQTYSPARVVATMPVHRCAKIDVYGNCNSPRERWITAIYRDDNSYTASKQKHHASSRVYSFTKTDTGRNVEFFGTFDNRTYFEMETPSGIPQSTFWKLFVERHAEEITLLLDRVREVARQTSASEKLVLRVEHGYMWEIPQSHWTPGERALLGIDCIEAHRLAGVVPPGPEQRVPLQGELFKDTTFFAAENEKSE